MGLNTLNELREVYNYEIYFNLKVILYCLLIKLGFLKKN